ncbi:MAG: hypothetical protein LBU64_06440 [Planctomycetota bacterium]|jgi:hypothetical protein|nr:hypothetical protein [Planctomycetota bacterium]
MDAVRKIEVNGREYTVRMFSPIQAHEYYWGREMAVRRGDSLEPLYRRAIGQCLDSLLRPLSEAGNFLQCFSDHPEDLFPLGARAEDALIAPFLAKADATG